jgi:hypothetical protein
MGSKERERLQLEVRIDVLRKLQIAMAKTDPVNFTMLAAVRELLVEAEASLAERLPASA